MSNIKILKHDEININDIKYSEPIKSKRSYISLLSFDDKDIYIQTPVLKCVSTLKEIYKTRCLTLEIPMNQLSLYIWFQDLEKNTINKSHLNSLKWFNKNIPKNIVEDYYKNFINTKNKNTNKKYTIKCKLPFENDILQCVCYNESNSEISIDDIEVNMNIAVILNINKLVFEKQLFSLDIKVAQLKVYKELFDKYKHITERCIIEDSDSDDFDKSMVFDDFDNDKKMEENNNVKENENDKRKDDQKEGKDDKKMVEDEQKEGEDDKKMVDKIIPQENTLSNHEKKQLLTLELQNLQKLKDKSIMDLERIKQLVLNTDKELNRIK